MQLNVRIEMLALRWNIGIEKVGFPWLDVGKEDNQKPTWSFLIQKMMLMDKPEMSLCKVNFILI